MRAWLLLILVIATGAAAQPRKFAVVSLVGDGLLVVTREAGVGRGSEKQGRQVVALADPALDNAAVLAAEDALRRADPAASAVLLAVRDAGVAQAQMRAIEERQGTEAIVAALKPLLAGADATHLLLFTKFRHEAMVRIAGGSLGSGHLEGLGFYVDRTKAMINTRTGDRARGFVAPFAYFTLSLVELPSGRVLRERNVYESTTITRPGADDPWEALGAEEKVRVLQGLLRRETARVVPALLTE